MKLNVIQSGQENELTESGEKTYFPALRVGADKPSAVVSLSLIP